MRKIRIGLLHLLPIANTRLFEDNTSIPANLSDNIIESIREDVQKRI